MTTESTRSVTPPPGVSIDPRAVVSPDARLGEGVAVGPFAIVEGNVTIGDGSRIDSHALIASGARLGRECRVHHGAVIATVPQDLKFGGEETTAEIGDRSVVREYATINRGTSDRDRTVIGADCLIMSYAHVAHDCLIGDRVILANSVNLAGHVTIGDWAIIGGVVPVHQFVRIGAHAMIGGGFRVPQDVPPFALVGGYPLRVATVNRLGLERRGFSAERIKALEDAFRILFRSKRNTTQALAELEVASMTDDVTMLVEFVRGAKRGIVK